MNTAPQYLTGSKRFCSLIALSLATFLIVLDYSVANVSIPYLAGDLAVSADQGTYVITSFAVGNAIVLPISGWLTARIGSVKLLQYSLLLFVLFSWICGIADNFTSLVLGRFFQGFVAGPLIPLSQSLLISTNPPEKKNNVLAFWSCIVIIAPVIGPLLGGWISFDYTWPWIFYINIPFGLLSYFLVFYTLKDFKSPIQKKPVDLLGFFLLAIAVSSLQIILDKGEQFDWFESPIIQMLTVLSVLGFSYLIVWELTHPHPLIELKLFQIRSFGISAFFMLIMYGMYFGAVVLIPLWLQSYMGYNSIWAGVAVAPLGIIPVFFAPFSGKLVTKYGSLIPLFFCFIFFSFSCFYTAFFDTDVDIKHVWVSRLLTGAAISFFITPLFSLSMQDLDNEQLPSAAGLFHFIRAMSGAIGTSLFTTLWIRRQAYHHERVGSSFHDSFLDTLSSLGLKGKQGVAMTNSLLDQQASVLSLNDCFYLMGWLFLLLIFLLPFARRKKKRIPS